MYIIVSLLSWTICLKRHFVNVKGHTKEDFQLFHVNSAVFLYLQLGYEPDKSYLMFEKSLKGCGRSSISAYLQAVF